MRSNLSGKSPIFPGVNETFKGPASSGGSLKHKCMFQYDLLSLRWYFSSSCVQNVDLSIIFQLEKRRGIKRDMRKWGLTWAFFANLLSSHQIVFNWAVKCLKQIRRGNPKSRLQDKTKKNNPIWVSELSSWFACCFRLFCMWCLTLSILETFLCLLLRRGSLQVLTCQFTLNLSTATLIATNRVICKIPKPRVKI